MADICHQNKQDPMISDCVDSLSDKQLALDFWSDMPVGPSLRGDSLLDEDLSLDLIPQPAYPSPDYESESLSPLPTCYTKMSDRTLYNSVGSYEPDLMSELGSVNFSDLMAVNEETLMSQDLPSVELFDNLLDVGTSENASDPAVTDKTVPGTDLAVQEAMNKAQTVTSRKHSLESDTEDSGEEETPQTADPDYEPSKYNLRGCGRKTKDQNDNTVNTNQPLTIVIGPSKTQLMLKTPSTSKGKVVPILQKTVAKTKAAVKQVKQKEEDLRLMMSPYQQHLEDLEDKSRKNAIQARINRQKKKAYIQSLEEQVTNLTKDNGQIKSKMQSLQKDKDSLIEEVEYLKSVIANQSTLSSLLERIPDVEGVELSSSFAASRKRSSEQDHDYGRPSSTKRPRQPSKPASSGGVCLHVANSKVSLEFCSRCAAMAPTHPNKV